MNVDDEVRGITRLLLSCFRQLFFKGHSGVIMTNSTFIMQ